MFRTTVIVPFEAIFKIRGDSDISLGQRVTHKKFGEGVVTNYEGEGRHARIEVNFSDVGSKWLMLSYANLEPA